MKIKHINITNSVFVAIIITLAMFINSAMAEDSGSVDLGAEPDQLVRTTSEKIRDTLNNDGDRIRSDPEFLRQKIDEIVMPLVDTEAVAKLILSTHWRSASPEQRTRFVEELKGMLIRTYSKSIDDYSDVKVEILPPRGKESEGRRTVTTETSSSSSKPLQVDYRFRLKDGQWKAYDVVIDGLSIVKNFRTNFNEEIAKTSLDTLIDRLANTDTEEELDALSGADKK